MQSNDTVRFGSSVPVAKMLAVSNSVFLCNSRFPVFCPVRKLSTAVLWRAGRRLTCLFNAASKAQVHDVTISHYKETVNYLHVTF